MDTIAALEVHGLVSQLAVKLAAIPTFRPNLHLETDSSARFAQHEKRLFVQADLPAGSVLQ